MSRLILGTLALLTLGLSQEAFAFGGRIGYDDPSSKIGSFFTDTTRADRDAPNWNGTSPAELQARWMQFQDRIRSSNLVQCPSWRKCDTTQVPQWLDWDLWYRLNVDAAELWDALVACAENQDPERARIAYYRAKSFCPRDSRQDEELKARVHSLHGRVRDFVNSTNVGWADKIWDKEAIQLLRTLVPAHPLFAQVITEYAATIVRFHKQRWNHIGRIAFDDSWIDGRYGRSFGDRVEAILNGDPKAISERFQQARAFANIHLILGFLPYNSPEVPGWGLWREGSTMLVALMAQQMVISQTYTRNSRQVSHLTFGVRNPFNKEESGDKEIQLPELILNEEASVVTEYRAMAERYGFPTYRYRLCSAKPLVYNICFGLDPSNPDETMDGF